MSLGLSPHEIDAQPEEPRTLSVRWGRDGRSVEVRVQTAALMALLTAVLGGGVVSLKAESKAATPAALEGLANRATSLESRTAAVEGEVKDVKGEIRQMRRDATDDARWEALYRRDDVRVRELDRRRRQLAEAP